MKIKIDIRKYSKIIDEVYNLVGNLSNNMSEIQDGKDTYGEIAEDSEKMIKQVEKIINEL